MRSRGFLFALALSVAAPAGTFGQMSLSIGGTGVTECNLRRSPHHKGAATHTRKLLTTTSRGDSFVRRLSPALSAVSLVPRQSQLGRVLHNPAGASAVGMSRGGGNYCITEAAGGRSSRGRHRRWIGGSHSIFRFRLTPDRDRLQLLITPSMEFSHNLEAREGCRVGERILPFTFGVPLSVSACLSVRSAPFADGGLRMARSTREPSGPISFQISAFTPPALKSSLSEPTSLATHASGAPLSLYIHRIPKRIRSQQSRG